MLSDAPRMASLATLRSEQDLVRSSRHSVRCRRLAPFVYISVRFLLATGWPNPRVPRGCLAIRL